MSLTRCIRIRDLVVTAVGFVVVAVLVATGNESWTSATTAALIPAYLVVWNRERRRRK